MTPHALAQSTQTASSSVIRMKLIVSTASFSVILLVTYVPSAERLAAHSTASIQGVDSTEVLAGKAAEGGAGAEAANVSPGAAAAANAPGQMGPVSTGAAPAEQPGPGASCSLSIPLQHY